jgi:hypothetical protein
MESNAWKDLFERNENSEVLEWVRRVQNTAAAVEASHTGVVSGDQLKQYGVKRWESGVYGEEEVNAIHDQVVSATNRQEQMVLLKSWMDKTKRVGANKHAVESVPEMLSNRIKKTSAALALSKEQLVLKTGELKGLEAEYKKQKEQYQKDYPGKAEEQLNLQLQHLKSLVFGGGSSQQNINEFEEVQTKCTKMESKRSDVLSAHIKLVECQARVQIFSLQEGELRSQTVALQALHGRLLRGRAPDPNAYEKDAERRRARERERKALLDIGVDDNTFKWRRDFVRHVNLLHTKVEGLKETKGVTPTLRNDLEARCGGKESQNRAPVSSRASQRSTGESKPLRADARAPSRVPDTHLRRAGLAQREDIGNRKGVRKVEYRCRR